MTYNTDFIAAQMEAQRAAESLLLAYWAGEGRDGFHFRNAKGAFDKLALIMAKLDIEDAEVIEADQPREVSNAPQSASEAAA